MKSSSSNYEITKCDSLFSILVLDGTLAFYSLIPRDLCKYIDQTINEKTSMPNLYIILFTV